MPFFSTTLTVTTAAQAVTTNKQGVRRVIQMQIVVRSMGTATYIAVGGSDSQDRRLTSAGASVSITAEKTDNGKLIPFNPLEIFAISDTSDGVLEIFGQGDI